MENNNLLELSRALDRIMAKMKAKDKTLRFPESNTPMIEAFLQPNPDKRKVMNKYARMYYNMPLEELRKRKLMQDLE